MSTERSFLHDISSPLTSVQLNIESVIMLIEEAKPEDVKNCLRMLNTCLVQLKRASDMVRNRRDSLLQDDGQ